MFISAYQQYIFAYQDFCLSAFMPIINFISLMHLQHANQASDCLLPFGWFGKFSSKFFSKKFSPEKQTLNTKSLLRAENQTRNCKTIFQKSTKSKEKTKSQNPKNALNTDNLKFFSRLLPRDYIGSSLFHFWLLVDVFFCLLADVWKLILLWSL